MRAVLESEVEAAAEERDRLKRGAREMLEQRIAPCEQRIEKLKTEATVMMEEKVKPCEAKIELLREETSVMMEQVIESCAGQCKCPGFAFAHHGDDGVSANQHFPIDFGMCVRPPAQGIKPCEAKIEELALELEVSAAAVTAGLERVGALSDQTEELSRQCAWTTAALVEESAEREAVDRMVGQVSDGLSEVEVANAAYWTGVDSSLRSLEQNIEQTLSEKVNPCMTQIAEIRAETTEVGTKLRQEVESIDSRLSTVVEEVNNSMSTRLASCNDDVSRHASTITAVRTQVEEIGHRCAWTAEQAMEDVQSVASRVELVEGALVDWLETIVSDASAKASSPSTDRAMGS
eukprot:SAG11_NODE_771_length_7253_cov_2.635741_10_plen_348_part_00